MIRRGTAADLPALADLAASLVRSFGPDYPEPDLSQILATLRAALERGFILVSDTGHDLDGMLLLERGRFSWSSAPVILDRGFYARGSGAALLRAARAIGRALGLPVYVTRMTRATVLLGRRDRP